MSYILDALKKQEQDREIGHTPTVDTQQLSAWPQSDRRTLALVLTVVVLLALVAFLAGFIWSKLDAPDASPQPVAASSNVTKKPGPSSAMPVKQFTAPVKPSPVEHMPVSSKPAVDSQPVSASRAPVVSASTEPVEKAPLLEHLSFAERQGLPALSLDVHVYAEQQERRFVLLNLKKMREGDKLDNIVVEAITPAGVVLSHNGVRFRLQRQ